MQINKAFNLTKLYETKPNWTAAILVCGLRVMKWFWHAIDALHYDLQQEQVYFFLCVIESQGKHLSWFRETVWLVYERNVCSSVKAPLLSQQVEEAHFIPE